MRPLKRLQRLQRSHDRGAVSVVVAITLVFVLVPMTAFVINAGSLYLARQNAQNGADAAALALAKACATAQPECTTDVAGTDLSPLVSANVNPGSAELSAPPCIQRDGTVCAEHDLTTLADCPYPLPASLDGVQVRARADIELPFPFLEGPSDGRADTCASAAWGPLGSHTASVPITISECGWEAQGGDAQAAPGGSGYGYGGDGMPPWPAQDKELTVVTTGDSNTCLVDGRTANGGFSWLVANGCQTQVSNGEWVNGDPGNNLECPDITDYLGKTILVPVYDCAVVSKTGAPSGTPSGMPSCNIEDYKGGGSNVWYHIKGWASFYLSGWSFSGNRQASILTGNTSCGGNGNSQRCLFGWFTKNTLSDGEIDPTAPEFGVSVIEMTG